MKKQRQCQSLHFPLLCQRFRQTDPRTCRTGTLPPRVERTYLPLQSVLLSSCASNIVFLNSEGSSEAGETCHTGTTISYETRQHRSAGQFAITCDGERGQCQPLVMCTGHRGTQGPDFDTSLRSAFSHRRRLRSNPGFTPYGQTVRELRVPLLHAPIRQIAQPFSH